MSMLAEQSQAQKFSEVLHVCCPESLRAAIDLAASRNGMKMAEWMRAAMLKELRNQSIDPYAVDLPEARQ